MRKQSLERLSTVKFSNLSDKDKSYIKTVHADNDLSWDERMSMLINRFNKSERTLRRWIKKLGFSNHEEIENEEIRQGKLREYDPDKKYYIITWAQNATPVHAGFWNNILAYADHLKANVGVIQGRYQNPTSLWTKNMRKSEWWDEAFTVYKTWPSGAIVYEDTFTQEVITEGDEHRTVWKNHDGELLDDAPGDNDGEYWEVRLHPSIRPVVNFTYLDAGRHNIHSQVDLLSDVKIVPTAVNPLTGFQGVSGSRSSILGHPRIHLQSLPVLEGHPKKLLATTGAVTIKNYTDTKAGKKAEFHHTYGFVIIEIKDEFTYYIRQVTASDQDGSFTDLNRRVENGEIKFIDNCAAFVMGDIHHANLNKQVSDRTIHLFENSIKPRRVVLHDLLDGQSVNHWEAKDPIKAYHRYLKGDDDVSNEISNAISFVKSLLEYNPIVVRSNHDIWLDRWVKDKDWKKDVKNATEYMEYALILLKGLDEDKGLLPYLLKEEFGSDVIALGIDDGFKISGWELGNHGHLGSHGSKGNLEQFRKLNTKVIVGDYHQPGRKDGAVSVGTYSKLRLGYNPGPSAWMNAGAIVHNDGKAQHIIFMEDGDFTTLL